MFVNVNGDKNANAENCSRPALHSGSTMINVQSNVNIDANGNVSTYHNPTFISLDLAYSHVLKYDLKFFGSASLSFEIWLAYFSTKPTNSLAIVQIA